MLVLHCDLLGDTLAGMHVTGRTFLAATPLLVAKYRSSAPPAPIAKALERIGGMAPESLNTAIRDGRCPPSAARWKSMAVRVSYTRGSACRSRGRLNARQTQDLNRELQTFLLSRLK